MAADALRAAVRSQLRFVLPVLGGAALLLLYLVLVRHARFDGPTTALVVAGIALVACLRALYRVVHALAQPDLQTILEQAGEIGSASDRELREERRRLLRALNELRFDHEMGKLSLADYDKVREGYELRAIEVMRRLDAGRGVHPELAKRIGLEDGAVVEPVPSEVVTDRVEMPRESTTSGESKAVVPEAAPAPKSNAEETG